MNDLPKPTRMVLYGIWTHISRVRRIQLGFLLLLMLLSGGAELISLGSVLPFLTVISDPTLLWKQAYVKSIAVYFGFTQPSDLLIPASVIFASAAIVSGVIRMANLYMNGRLAASIGSDLSCEAYRITLYQPYEVHVQRNSASLIAGVTAKSERTVWALSALLQLITASVIVLSIFLGLLLIDWIVAVGALLLFFSVYYLLALTSRKELGRNSKKIAAASILQIKALQEGLGAIRDVLLDNNQSVYVEIYRRTDWPQRHLQAKNKFLSSFPRYAVEALGLTAIALLALLLVIQQGFNSNVLPLLGAMALGAQRLLPALQQVYGGWSKIKSFNSDLEDLLSLLDDPLPTQADGVKQLKFCKDIKLINVEFRYSNEKSNVLSCFNLHVRRGERLGIIGRSGSGKSTAVDIIMGLLKPNKGSVLIDGKDIYDLSYPERITSWRASIAHVPQSIYLSDSSIAENIAFGETGSEIDLERVAKAAQQAQLSELISSMPEGYKTFVGERGINLSGGQRQRIGIARALYKRAQILVLDEATAALDNNTEEAVIDAVSALSSDLTIISIAHRLSTLSKCDRIVRIENGTICTEGPPSLFLD